MQGSSPLLAPASPGPAEPQAQAAQPPPLALAYKPLLAWIEAVPTGAGEMAQTLLHLCERQGLRCALLSLDPQNRLGARLGHPERSPYFRWHPGAVELLRPYGSHWVVPAPDLEESIEGASLGLLLDDLVEMADLVAIELGCRWHARLFRPVLGRATHIWLITQPGKGSALEMRMEQAEFSGWTEMRKVRQIVLGPGAHTERYGSPVIHLPDPAGRAAQEFIRRELGG